MRREKIIVLGVRSLVSSSMCQSEEGNPGADCQVHGLAGTVQSVGLWRLQDRSLELEMWS